MLRNPRVLQLFRRPPLYKGLLTASSKRTDAILPTASTTKTIIGSRAFATIRSSPWRLPQFSPAHRMSPARAARSVRLNSTRAGPGQEFNSTQNLSLSDRMKQMSRKYGWTVVGIYLGLSVLDFPFCFLAVRLFGTERIGHLEHVIVDGFWSMLESVAPSLKERRQRKEAEAALAYEQEDVVAAGTVVAHKQGDASLWTQLLLAYGVHKSLLFIRIPITLAITPRVVKVLRSWGWKIGKTTTKTT